MSIPVIGKVSPFDLTINPDESRQPALVPATQVSRLESALRASVPAYRNLVLPWKPKGPRGESRGIRTGLTNKVRSAGIPARALPGAAASGRNRRLPP